MAQENDAPVTFGGIYYEEPLSQSSSQQVVFQYHKNTNRILSWQIPQDSKDGKPKVDMLLSEDHIICTHLISGNGPEWHLYYAEVKPKPEHAPEQEYKVERNTYLKLLVLFDPPAALVDKYSLKPECPVLSIPLTRPVVSTLSGGEHAEAVFNNLVGPFLNLVARQTGHLPQETFRTSSASSITEFAKGPLLEAAQRGEKQLVVLLSGDGGIVDIVNAIAGKALSVPPVVALVPCGTGNALANSTSVLPLASPTLGLRTLALGGANPLPLLEASFDPPATVYAPEADTPSESAQPLQSEAATVSRVHAAVVISWGLHAALVADSDTPAYRKHGAARFGLAAHENLFPSDGSLPHAYRGDLSLADNSSTLPHSLEPINRQEHAYVLATLVSRLERGFCISPDSRPLDGQLRVIHFGPQPQGGEGVMELMKAAYDGGRHVQDSSVGYVAASQMSLQLKEEATRWRRICVDGKIFVAAENGRLDVTTAKGKPVIELVHVV